MPKLIIWWLIIYIKSYKKIRDVNTLAQEVFQEELGLSDEEFEEQNKSNEVEDKFVLSAEAE